MFGIEQRRADAGDVLLEFEGQSGQRPVAIHEAAPVLSAVNG